MRVWGGGEGGRRGNAGVWTKCSLCPQSRAIVTLIIAKCYFWGWICKMLPFLNWYVSGCKFSIQMEAARGTKIFSTANFFSSFAKA